MTWEEYEEQRWLQSQQEEDAFWEGKLVAGVEGYFIPGPEKCPECGFQTRGPGLLCECCVNGCQVYNEYIRCPLDGYLVGLLKGGELPDLKPRPHLTFPEGRIFERLKEIDLASHTERYTRLKQVGPATWKGLCPLHKEDTASFYIYMNPWRFHCYGCDRHGDIIDLEREIGHGKGG